MKIVPWNSDRHAVTGISPDWRQLLDRLQERTAARFTIEFWRGPNFTLSFPQRFAGIVRRVVDELESP